MKTRAPQAGYGAKRRRAGGDRCPREPVRGWEQVTHAELFSRIAAVASREHLGGKLPRPQMRRGLGALWDALWRRARAEGSMQWNWTWSQMMAAVGSDEDAQRLTTMVSYVKLLTEAGLISQSEVKYGDGSSRCIRIRLLAPPPLPSGASSPCSSTGRAADS